eukprot:4429863-Prymnesium_polylepis.2
MKPLVWHVACGMRLQRICTLRNYLSSSPESGFRVASKKGFCSFSDRTYHIGHRTYHISPGLWWGAERGAGVVGHLIYSGGQGWLIASHASRGCCSTEF